MTKNNNKTKFLDKGSRMFGNLLASVILLVIIAIFNKYYIQIPYINDDFPVLLWALNVSFFASFVYHLVLIVYDENTFKSILSVTRNLISLWVFWTAYTIFPFDFSPVKSINVTLIAKTIIIFIIIGLIIRIIVEFVHIFRQKDSN